MISWQHWFSFEFLRRSHLKVSYLLGSESKDTNGIPRRFSGYRDVRGHCRHWHDVVQECEKNRNVLCYFFEKGLILRMYAYVCTYLRSSTSLIQLTNANTSSSKEGTNRNSLLSSSSRFERRLSGLLYYITTKTIRYLAWYFGQKFWGLW